jgi:RNA polymerase sigma-70 factor (ECF subfamily)
MTPATRLTDAELMCRVQADDPEAFRLLYDRYARTAMGVALSITRNQRHAEDAVQEAFLAAWRARAGYAAGRGNVAGWLLTIVRNRAVDALRRAGTSERPWEQLSDHELADVRTEAPEALVVRNEDGRAVHAAFTILPAEQATALRLAYFSGLSQTEIAHQLDVPLGTIKSRMRLGLRRMAGELSRTGAMDREPVALTAAP